MFSFIVIDEDYIPQTFSRKIRTTELTMLEQAVASNSFELYPGNIGMFLGVRHEFVLQARERIQADTQLRLHHLVSKDGAVTFHFCGQIQKKNSLRLAYQTLFNTLGKRSIETGFGAVCDSSVIKYVLGKQHTNIKHLIKEAGGDQNISVRYYNEDEMIGLLLQKSPMAYQELLDFVETFEELVEDEATKFQNTYIPDEVDTTAMSFPNFSIGDHSWASTPSSDSDATTGPSDVSPTPSEDTVE